MMMRWRKRETDGEREEMMQGDVIDTIFSVWNVGMFVWRDEAIL